MGRGVRRMPLQNLAPLCLVFFFIVRGQQTLTHDEQNPLIALQVPMALAGVQCAS